MAFGPCRPIPFADHDRFLQSNPVLRPSRLWISGQAATTQPTDLAQPLGVGAFLIESRSQRNRSPIDLVIDRTSENGPRICLFDPLHKHSILDQPSKRCAALHKDIEMNKALFSLAALVVAFAASSSQAATVNFDSGSSKMNNAPVVKHQKYRKHKVWVPTHRSHGRLIKGHYVWR